MNAQARLGAFVLLALILLVFATGRITDFSWDASERHYVEAEFDDLMGLDVQSPVRMAGVRVGSVSQIRLKNNRAVVRIALDPGVKLPASTHASIISRGLVGEKNLSLAADPDDDQWLPDGATIPSDPTGDINSLISKATGITEGLGSLAGQSGGPLPELVDNMNRTVNELTVILRENRTQLQAITNSLQHLTGKLERSLPATINSGHAFFDESTKTSKVLNQLLLDNREDLYRTAYEMRRASENLEAFSDDIRRNPWKLLKEKPEVKADRQAEQRKMEELLLKTGRMGLAPARE